MTPILRSERLELRELELEDDEFILRLLNEDGFLRFIGDKGVRTLADAREYLSKGPIDSYRRFGFGLYLTSLRGGTPIGICGLVKRDTLARRRCGLCVSVAILVERVCGGIGGRGARVRQRAAATLADSRHHRPRQLWIHRRA